LVAPAHLESFGTLENVAIAKAEIVEGLPRDGVFYVNVDNPWCVKAAERHSGEKVNFGSHGDVALKSAAFQEDGDTRLDIDPIGTLRLPLASAAHAVNVLIAVAVGLRHGVAEFEAPLRRVLAEPARFRVVMVDGIEIIDDTYNASPASMAAALEGLCQRPCRGARMAALGDMLELGPDSPRYHAEIGALAGRLGLRRVFALGAYASAMIESARAAGVPHAEAFPNHRDLAGAVRAVAAPGDVLLVKGSRDMRMEGVIEALRDAPA
jgi:UDP-N-acetylmuramyl pentapeptide synthase